MQVDWKNKPVVQFAIGISLMALVIYWLVSGMVGNVAAAVQPLAEGQTRSVSLTDLLWPMVWQAGVMVGAFAIGMATRVWSTIYSAIQKTQSSNPDAPESVAAAPVSTESLVVSLAQAAATNNDAELAKLRKQIRKPYALEALNQAISEGDNKLAEELFLELTSQDPPVKATTKTGGAK